MIKDFPTPEQVLAFLRAAGQKAHRASDLREKFAVGRERKGEFRGLLRLLERRNLIRSVKGHKYVARLEQPDASITAPLSAGPGGSSAPRIKTPSAAGKPEKPGKAGGRPLPTGGSRGKKGFGGKSGGRGPDSSRRGAGRGWTQEQIPFAQVSRLFFKENAVPFNYPAKPLKEAALLPEPDPENYPGRRDMRHIEIYTIDPQTAKDHDDAISLERKGKENWLLGVHIADVAEYVLPDTSIDQEALQRAFTQYLPWTAAPMLPDYLSGNLCSLMEGVDRLAFSCLMEVNSRGEVVNFEFVETLIRVRKFYSYEEAQSARDGGDKFLAQLDTFAKILTERRKREGYIDFQFPEPRVENDENGVPVRIYIGARLASHAWIEECMLLTNQVAAQFMQRHGIPGLYRVHEDPDLDNVAELASLPGITIPPKMLKAALSAKKKGSGNINPGIQQLFARLLDEPESLPVSVQRKILQSMKKARYSSVCEGHFALGWLYYAHFTSPIRRYADLWTHRVMKAFLRRQNMSRKWIKRAERIGESISEREIAVMKTERKGMRTAMAWTMQAHLGEEFTGEVSGLENFGLFVTIKDPYAEGLVPINRLSDDYYEKDSRTGHLVGRRTRRQFVMGQKIRVRLDKADPVSSQLDFDFLESLP